MNVIYVALPVALMLGGLGLLACILCIRTGQYDDIDTASIRILVDEKESGRIHQRPSSKSLSTTSTEPNDV